MVGAKEFFSAVLPASGWFYVAAVTDKQGKAKHKGYQTYEAVEAAEWAVSGWNKRDKYSVYFTPCTWTQQYTTNEDGKNKNCRKHPELTHRLKAFWLDLDLRKKGTTEAEALRSITSFCESISLPYPNVSVRTGGGLHLYWALDREVSLEEWAPVAAAFKNACVLRSVDADHVCTADSARIMRLPGSQNLKYAEKPVCEVLCVGKPVSYDAFAEALAPFRVPTSAELHCNDEFSGGMEYLKGRIEVVVTQCPLLAAVAADEGAQCSEPLWKGILHMCAHAEDGAEWAHTFSRGHAGYSMVATDRKLASCDTKVPPTRCTTLEENFWEAPAPCAACPHKGKIKGPMSLGRGRTEGTVRPPAGLPDGYVMTTSGVFQVSKDKEGNDNLVRVTQVPIVELHVHDVLEFTADDAKVTPNIQMTFVDGIGRQHKGSFPMAILPDYRALFAAMSSIKFPFTRFDHKNGFDILMTSWVQKLRESGEVSAGKPQFGWHFKSHDEVEGFAIGKTMFLPDGTTKIMMWPDTQLNHIYATEGSIDEWRKAVELIRRRDRPELMVLIAGAFAGPLFTFLGESSAVVSAVSRESGVGKSSALKVAQAVWGNPKSGLSSLDDTAKSVARKMGIIKHLPVFWDELRLTDETAQDFLQMMFQLSQGRERTRLTSGVDFRDVGTWETILVCASNNHLADMATDNTRSNANLKRLFEYDIPYDGETPKSVDGTEIFNNLRFNYGHAGVEYAKFLVCNVKQVRYEVLQMNKYLFNLVGAKNEDRYWIGTMACLLMGATFAKKLGLVDFNIESIKQFLIRTYRGMQVVEEESIEHDSSSRLLAEFMRENGGASLIYKSAKPKRGLGSTEPVITRPPTDLKQGIIWEYYAESGTLRISRYPFHDFLKRHRQKKKEFFADLERSGYFVSEARFVLGINTRFSSLTRAYAYEIDVPAKERESFTEQLNQNKEDD